jgi:membrane-associated phospholipid phosphatase
MRATCCPCALFVLAFAASAAAQELTIASADIPSSLSTTQDPQEKPAPPPEGTGWKTLLNDTALDFKAFPQRRSTWVILAGGGALALAVHPADDYVESHIVGNDAANKFFAVGKVIGSAYFQAGSAIGLWVVGRYVLPPQPDGSRTNRVSHLGFDLMRAQIITQTLVNGIKVTVRRDRPTGECCAFPSGHAASAFAAASVLERHLGYRASWPALVAATYVATSRLVDNRHFLSDVVFGAAVGEAAGWTVVGRHGRSQYALQPVPIRGGMMVALVRTGN